MDTSDKNLKNSTSSVAIDIRAMIKKFAAEAEARKEETTIEVKETIKDDGKTWLNIVFEGPEAAVMARPFAKFLETAAEGVEVKTLCRKQVDDGTSRTIVVRLPTTRASELSDKLTSLGETLRNTAAQEAVTKAAEFAARVERVAAPSKIKMGFSLAADGLHISFDEIITGNEMLARQLEVQDRNNFRLKSRSTPIAATPGEQARADGHKFEIRNPGAILDLRGIIDDMEKGRLGGSDSDRGGGGPRR